MTTEDDPIEEQETPSRRRRINGWLIVGVIAAVLAGLLLARSVWQDRWNEASEVPQNAIAEASTPDPEALCSAQPTYDAIRRELFRRAAQVRGSDQQAYTRLSDFALLRMSGPIVRGIDPELDSVTCSATANLDLPPGVRTSGGQRSLSGDLDYLVQPAADGTGNVVRLGNADSIVVPLATLSRAAAPSTAPLVPPELEDGLATDGEAGDEPAEQPPEAGPQPTTASPSFDCGAARTGAEVAICGDPGLAALDRQMASQFRTAMMQADRSQRRLLERTRGRFLSYRNRCATNQCIAETYRSRMREITDIMADRWRG